MDGLEGTARRRAARAPSLAAWLDGSRHAADGVVRQRRLPRQQPFRRLRHDREAVLSRRGPAALLAAVGNAGHWIESRRCRWQRGMHGLEADLLQHAPRQLGSDTR